MKTTEWKYVFVGAGPAALASVLSLSEGDRKRSVIIEAGASAKRKICPGLKAKRCLDCDGEMCPVLNGVGGASATLGNKLCYFPASSGIVQSRVGIQAGYEDLIPKELKRIGVSPPSSQNVATFPGAFAQKFYESDRLFLHDYRRLMNVMIGAVRQSTEIHSSLRVKDIRKTRDGKFEIECDEGSTYSSERVVVGVGRSGHKDTREWCRRLGVSVASLPEDVGYRFEVPSAVVSREFLYQTDPKFRIECARNGTARTFCTCHHGAIVPVKFDDASFADGAFLRSETGATNFAVMGRAETPLGHEALASWCRSVNELNDGNLLIASVSCAGKRGSDIVAELLAVLPDGPSEAHTAIIREAVGLVFGGATSPVTSDCPENTRIAVYGPAIDRYWAAPEINNGFQTNVPGLYFIGDAAGRSRGIFQAIASGVMWARDLADTDVIRRENKGVSWRQVGS